MKSKIIKKDAELIIKDDKINELIKKMNDLLISNKSMEESLNKANYKLDETLEKLDDVHE